MIAGFLTVFYAVFPSCVSKIVVWTRIAPTHLVSGGRNAGACFRVDVARCHRRVQVVRVRLVLPVSFRMR